MVKRILKGNIHSYKNSSMYMNMSPSVSVITNKYEYDLNINSKDLLREMVWPIKYNQETGNPWKLWGIFNT